MLQPKKGMGVEGREALLLGGAAETLRKATPQRHSPLGASETETEIQ